MHRIGRKNAHQAVGTECNRGKCIVIWQRCQDHIAVGELAELRRTASSGGHQIRDPLRIPVADQHLVSVLNKIGRKGVAHMAQTDNTDAPDDELRRSRRVDGRLLSVADGAT